MILTTLENPVGAEIVEFLGIARGNTVRTRHMGKDIIAAFRNLVGGEVPEYTKLIAEAREQALNRLEQNAKAMGADAVVGIRFTTSSIAQGAAELFAYGTAVKLQAKA